MAESSAKAKLEERMKRLKELHLKRNEARSLNHHEVLEEERRSSLPANFAARQRRAQWVLDEEEKRAKVEEEGGDFERVKLLHMQADELDRINRGKAKKKNPNEGFSTFENATAKQHSKLVFNLKVDMAEYEREKAAVGEEVFYGGKNSIVQGVHVDSESAIDRMVDDLNRQVEKREKFSRRRAHNDEADIDYINERNMKFNKKLERFYGQYTGEIKQNLERGTAI